jgi:hypothetical protein
MIHPNIIAAKVETKHSVSAKKIKETQTDQGEMKVQGFLEICLDISGNY